MTPTLDAARIAFVGGGNMARSLVGGLVARGVAPARIRVAEPVDALRDALAKDFAIDASADNGAVARDADVLVLAVKPQVMESVCAALPVKAGALVVSIAAGIPLAKLAAWLPPGTAIVRAMPNTPALLGAGVTGLCANAATDEARYALGEAVLASAGRTVRIPDESLMDAVTATSGSGPAYFFLLIESMVEAAVAQGLPREVATTLVLETAYGAARMAREASEDAAELRRRVTSPGGTTQAAIETFEAGGFRALVERAIARATERGRELAGR